MDSKNNDPAFLVAGVNSGSGKTTLTLALLAALTKRGLAPAPFKCGPDYIDPLFHRAAAGRVSHNLDLFMMGQGGVRSCFAASADVAVVEGVMGLFDGGTASTAEIALLLGLPVILVVNARGLADSIAPLVKGFAGWDKRLRVAGVIANFTGSPRHAVLLRDALERAGLPPLLGAFSRDESLTLPERHLGLATEAAASVDYGKLAEKAEREIDLDRLLELCRIPRPEVSAAAVLPAARLRLGVAYDEAFQFYYEENFRLLREHGVETVFFSPLHDRMLPEQLDGLYFGGGYPELHAAALAANVGMIAAVREFAHGNRPVYGECGGYLYLLETLEDMPMTGLLPGRAGMNNRLSALGYRELELAAGSFLGTEGTKLRGHEFHYSSLESPEQGPFLFRNSGGCCGSICGSYMHVHFASNPGALACWVEAMKKPC